VPRPLPAAAKPQAAGPDDSFARQREEDEDRDENELEAFSWVQL